MRKLWIRRKAVSTMIGGVIVLSLFLTALISVVFVSQQYDQYQTQASRMSQYDIQRLSEYLVANPPGLTLLTSSTAPGWGSGCGSGGTYNCYNMTVSNLGGVGVQIVRIYINSTGSGCTSLCVLNPTLKITQYAFNQANQFVNRGETNHVVVLALPSAVALPGQTNPSQPAFPMNAIFVATSMGNIFSFQWPFQVIPGVSSEAYSQGIMKVAYQKASGGYGTGFDSKNEPGPVAGNLSAGIPGSGGTVGTGYCHQESVEPYPAPPGYAEKLTVSGLTDNNLWFVNPWITAGNDNAILDSVDNEATTLYMYIIVINTGNTAYSPTAGTLDLTWFASNHIDGSLFGVYYKGIFSSPSTSPSIPEGAVYYAIFKIDNSIFMLNNPPPRSVMFWGGASITNVGPSGTSAENQNFYSGVILTSGLWIRYEPSSTNPCAV